MNIIDLKNSKIQSLRCSLQKERNIHLILLFKIDLTRGLHEVYFSGRIELIDEFIDFGLFRNSPFFMFFVFKDFCVEVLRGFWLESDESSTDQSF